MFSKKTLTRHAAAAQIQLLEAKLAAIDRSQAVIEFDLEGRILSANENFLKTMGYAARELVGQKHAMLVDPAYAASEDYAQFWRRLRAGEYIAAKFQRVAKGGRKVWIEAAYNPILGDDGRPCRVIKYATDVTQAEMTSADHASQISAIGRSQAVISFDLNGVILSANANFLKAMGYEIDDILGRHHSLFVEPGYELTAEYAEFWRRLGAGEFIAAEFKRVGEGGREVWIQASYNPIFDPDGRPYKVVKYATDVTAAKMREADNTSQLSAIDRSQAVIAFNLDGVILSANANFLKVVGYQPEEVIGKHHSIFVDPAYAKSVDYADFWRSSGPGNSRSPSFRAWGRAAPRSGSMPRTIRSSTPMADCPRS